MSRARGVIVALALALGAPRARADAREIDSVEWSLCEADDALDATVTSVNPMTAEEHVVTVRRREGARDERLLRMAPRDAMSYRVGERLLVFVRAHPGWGSRVVRVVREDRAEAVARDGAVLRGLDAIVARLAAYGPPRRARAVLLPHPQAADGPDDTVSLRVPADRATELHLRAMLASPSLPQRALAALLLAPFESSANIARLRALLDDRARFPGAAGPTACENARHTHRAWEVPVAPDACESETPATPR
ncbi:MAG: hypothetical protein U0325_34325 [Polyangiales bacterium]